jgi:aspartate-semialdehyde dehydrogenase
MTRQWKVAVLGATGLVGDTMIKVLEERKFPVAELFPLASNRSLGKSIEFNGKKVPVIDV